MYTICTSSESSKQKESCTLLNISGEQERIKTCHRYKNFSIKKVFIFDCVHNNLFNLISFPCAITIKNIIFTHH